jgi:hypothetical protein
MVHPRSFDLPETFAGLATVLAGMRCAATWIWMRGSGSTLVSAHHFTGRGPVEVIKMICEVLRILKIPRPVIPSIAQDDQHHVNTRPRSLKRCGGYAVR